MLTALIFVLLSNANAANTVEDTDVTVVTEADRSEYVRLQHELEKLASKNAWAGVERTYRAMEATGVPMAASDLKVGAHSARQEGDIKATRERLLQAHQWSKDQGTVEDPELLEWMWQIREEYGAVMLAADPGTRSLTVVSMPFNPVQAKAVRYAMAQVEATGRFEGWLPAGSYMFGDHEVKVRPGPNGEQVDYTTKDRKKKKSPKK